MQRKKTRVTVAQTWETRESHVSIPGCSLCKWHKRHFKKEQINWPQTQLFVLWYNQNQTNGNEFGWADPKTFDIYGLFIWLSDQGVRWPAVAARPLFDRLNDTPMWPSKVKLLMKQDSCDAFMAHSENDSSPVMMVIWQYDSSRCIETHTKHTSTPLSTCWTF